MTPEHFPGGFILHSEQRIATSKPGSGEECWIPGPTDGSFQQWTRIAPHAEATVLDVKGLKALLVVFERCVADYRSALARTLRANPYKERIRTTLPAPVGTDGKVMQVGTFDSKPQEGMVVWKEGGVLDRGEMQSAFGREPELRELGNAWLVVGEIRKLLEQTMQKESVMIPPVVVSQPEMSLPESNDTTLSDAVENGMQALSERLMEKAVAAGWSEERIRSLGEPARIIRENAANPMKNKAAMLTHMYPDAYSFVPAHPSYFAYDILPDVDYGKNVRAAARFYSNRRILKLPEHFDARNDLDMIVARHEMTHLLQDSRQRAILGSAYAEKERQVGKMRIDGLGVERLENEMEAYAAEIEDLNLLLDNRLANGELLHAGAIDEILRLLRASPDQQGIVRLVLFLAEGYYGGGTPLEVAPDYPPLFALRCACAAQRAKRMPVVSTAGEEMRPFTVKTIEELGPTRVMETA